MSKRIDLQKKYIDIISRLDEGFAELRSMRPIPESALRRYREEMDILLSHSSNAIEGNSFTYDETRLLIKEGVAFAARTMREHNDILGHSRAYRSLYDAVKKDLPITEEFILELHEKVLQGDDYAGKYRDAAVYVGNALAAAYTAPPDEKVPLLMKRYTETVRAETEDNIRAVRGTQSPDRYAVLNSVSAHHVEFERIHPFFDGNGRTGRLLLNYELLRMGLLPVGIPLEERARYGAAFTGYEGKERFAARPESRYEKMTKLLAECELSAMRQYLEMLGSRQPRK
jgi:Fic family protein